MARKGAQAAGGMSLGMESENFGYSRVRLRRVKKLQFGAVNPDELVSCASATKIENCANCVISGVLVWRHMKTAWEADTL